jgi:uncharacterized protein YdaU (DUF1376 family)
LSSAPYFKLYFSDLAGDTLFLSDAEIGSYLLLLGAMWNAGGSLPNEPAKLARVARVTPAKWPGRWAALESFFVVQGDRLTHFRIKSDRENVAGISAARSKNGKAGAEAKALKRLEAVQANASNSEQQTEKQAASIPEAIAIRERESNDPSLSGDAPRARKRRSETTIPDGFPDSEAMAEAETAVTAALVALDVAHHARRFRNHAEAQDRRVRNWPAAWRNWIEIEIGKAPPGGQNCAKPLLLAWAGPADVFEIVALAMTRDLAASYLGACEWQAGPPAVIVAPHKFAADRLQLEAGAVLQGMGVSIVVGQGRAA